MVYDHFVHVLTGTLINSYIHFHSVVVLWLLTILNGYR